MHTTHTSTIFTAISFNLTCTFIIEGSMKYFELLPFFLVFRFFLRLILHRSLSLYVYVKWHAILLHRNNFLVFTSFIISFSFFWQFIYTSMRLHHLQSIFWSWSHFLYLSVFICIMIIVNSLGEKLLTAFIINILIFMLWNIFANIQNKPDFYAIF